MICPRQWIGERLRSYDDSRDPGVMGDDCHLDLELGSWRRSERRSSNGLQGASGFTTFSGSE